MLIELILLGGAAASLWLFRRKAASDDPGEARALRAVTVVLAVIGVVALIVLAAMVLTHYGMIPEKRVDADSAAPGLTLLSRF